MPNAEILAARNSPGLDYLSLAKSRLEFLRHYYDAASAPFQETKANIERRVTPYAWPTGYEDAEPPYLFEWQQAEDSLDFLGQSVASHLSGTLVLYIDCWVAELIQATGSDQLTKLGVGLPSDTQYKKASRSGLLNGYRAYCERLDVDWGKCPADLGLLEELVLARNEAQHPKDLRTIRVKQSPDVEKRIRRPYFSDAVDLMLNSNVGPNPRWTPKTGHQWTPENRPPRRVS